MLRQAGYEATADCQPWCRCAECSGRSSGSVIRFGTVRRLAKSEQFRYLEPCWDLDDLWLVPTPVGSFPLLMGLQAISQKTPASQMA